MTDSKPTAAIGEADAIDWRSILVRYANAVMDDDICVGSRCLTDPDWCPEWTDAERRAVAAIRHDAWPEGYEGEAE